MKPRRHAWTVRLADAAAVDFAGILRWTTEQFGESQARLYETTLSLALDALTAGPKVAGAKARKDLQLGLYSLHVARNRRRGRHVILFRFDPARESTVEVLRLFHDSMDFTRHLPDSKGRD